MVGKRYAEVERRRPKLVVFGRWIVLAARITIELYPFYAELGAVLEFFHGVIHVRHRDGAHADNAVRRGRHIFLAQKFVVSTYAVFVELVVFGLSQHERDLRK